jgi:mannose-6-phosphate isomerase-like protein (cupin superfamily)
MKPAPSLAKGDELVGVTEYHYEVSFIFFKGRDRLVVGYGRAIYLYPGLCLPTGGS